MERIDVATSLYYIILPYEVGDLRNDVRLEKLKSILDWGSLFSPEEERIREIKVNDHDSFNDDCIKLVYNLYSDIAKKHDEGPKYDRWHKVKIPRVLSFVLNPHLVDDCDYRKGQAFELLVKKQILLDRYVDGVINAGADIDRNLIIFDWYMQYSFLEITREEYINRLSTYYGVQAGPDSWYFNEKLNKNGESFDQYMRSYIDKDDDDLILGKSYYEKVKQVMDFFGTDIPILDRFGNEITSIESQKNKVYAIKRRIGEKF